MRLPCNFVNRYEIKFEKDDYVLRVKKASVNDEGTFTCVTENRVGKLEASATLTVRGIDVLLFYLGFFSSTGTSHAVPKLWLAFAQKGLFCEHGEVYRQSMNLIIYLRLQE